MKGVHFVGSSQKDIRSFSEDVRSEVGYAIYLAQRGQKAVNAVPMVGFGGANVLEVIIDDDGNTYRAIYTVRFAEAIYVLHAFQKKSKRGISTPKKELDMVKDRLKRAEMHYRETYRVVKKGEGK